MWPVKDLRYQANSMNGSLADERSQCCRSNGSLASWLADVTNLFCLDPTSNYQAILSEAYREKTNNHAIKLSDWVNGRF
jgi:hypothetical protein